MKNRLCRYCNGTISFRKKSTFLYGRDLGPVWICDGCKAYVGCDPEGKPLGIVANKKLRMMRNFAHKEFDFLWKAKAQAAGISKNKARSLAYKWLASQLNIEPAKCHIAMFEEDMCEKVTKLCQPYANRIREKQG